MLKPAHTDLLIPLQENTIEKLTRLSANIATLATLIENSEQRGMQHLAAMFARS